MIGRDTSHRDRVNLALAFKLTDRVPKDFAATPEIWDNLLSHFAITSREQVLKKLDVDCRVVSYDSFCEPPDVDEKKIDMTVSKERSSVGGMWRKLEPDGSHRDIWGAHRQQISTHFGVTDQFASFPLESANTVDDLKRYHWPSPEWWNFKDLRSTIQQLNDEAIYHIRYRIGSVFETAWSLYDFERFMFDLALAPEKPVYVMERIAEVHLENLRVVLEAAGDLIDMVYFYDDIASQDGLLLSPIMYEKHIQPFHQQLIDLATHYGKPVMMHCCGSIYPLIERFIDMGLTVLGPIQTSAKDMHPGKLVEAFGDRIVFHGGIDIQKFLPYANPTEVRDHVKYVKSIMSKNGGYILAGSHHIQPDTPVENVLAMYDL